jgi:hypothetical protein
MKKVWFLLCHSVTWGAYDTPGSSNQTDRHDIAEILSKMGGSFTHAWSQMRQCFIKGDGDN